MWIRHPSGTRTTDSSDQDVSCDHKHWIFILSFCWQVSLVSAVEMSTYTDTAAVLSLWRLGDCWFSCRLRGEFVEWTERNKWWTGNIFPHFLLQKKGVHNLSTSSHLRFNTHSSLTNHSLHCLKTETEIWTDTREIWFDEKESPVSKTERNRKSEKQVVKLTQTQISQH